MGKRERKGGNEVTEKGMEYNETERKIERLQ